MSNISMNQQAKNKTKTFIMTRTFWIYIDYYFFLWFRCVYFIHRWFIITILLSVSLFNKIHWFKYQRYQNREPNFSCLYNKYLVIICRRSLQSNLVKISFQIFVLGLTSKCWRSCTYNDLVWRPNVHAYIKMKHT